MSAPTRATAAGRAYLDLRNLARATRRPVDELQQLYILEAFPGGVGIIENKAWGRLVILETM